MFDNFIFKTTNLFVNLCSECIIIKLFYITKIEASKELSFVNFFSVSHEKHWKNIWSWKSNNFLISITYQNEFKSNT